MDDRELYLEQDKALDSVYAGGGVNMSKMIFSKNGCVMVCY